jgi:hypothetical protein
MVKKVLGCMKNHSLASSREKYLHFGKLQGMFRATRNVFRSGKPLPFAGSKTAAEVGSLRCSVGCRNRFYKH